MQKFIARQPIFTSRRTVFGYELLFRSGPENFFGGAQPDIAAVATSDNLFLFGIEQLTRGRRAFLNCTREYVVRGYAALLPKDRVVLEILEDVRIDQEFIDACRTLARSGYLLALDDFQDAPEWQPLLALASFIKVDMLATPADEQFRLARRFAGTVVQLLAEKVESYDVFERAMSWGYEFFQGYFFARPQILARHDIPAHKLNHLLALQAAHRPKIDLDEVAGRIKAEPSLSYRLLRYLNSPMFALVSEVHSIPHALALLGENGIRKWVSLVAVACMGEDKPEELLLLPLIRARMCELLARLAGMNNSADDLFLLGLLSSMDAILDMPMESVLKEIALREEIRDALLGGMNPLRQIIDIALLYEKGAWNSLEQSATRLGIDSSGIPARFFEAVEWSQRMLSGERADETADHDAKEEPVVPGSPADPI